jgi:hypothetical protein
MKENSLKKNFVGQEWGGLLLLITVFYFLKTKQK